MTTPPTTSHHPACKLCRGTKEERAANQSRWQRRKWDFFPLIPDQNQGRQPEYKRSQGSVWSSFWCKIGFWSGLSRKWDPRRRLQRGQVAERTQEEIGIETYCAKCFFRGKKGEKVLQWWNGAFFLSPSFSIYIEPGGCMSKLIRPRFIWEAFSNQGLHYKVISLAKSERLRKIGG